MRRPVPRELDEDLLAAVEAGAPWRSRVWEPADVAVVLGAGTDGSKEVRLEACAASRVPVLRRRGGGGAVVLGPGCLVASLAAPVDRSLDVGGHLLRIASFLAETLAGLTALPLQVRGTGDVCAGDRKILGSSLFRRRNLLFYGASVLHSLDLGLVDAFLAHPLREPAYRRGRPHSRFLTTLAAEGVAVAAPELGQALERELPRLAGRLCAGSR